MKKQLLLVCAIALCTISLNAQTQWVSTGSTDFAVAANWNPAEVPDGVEVRTAGDWSTADMIIDQDATFTNMILGMAGTSGLVTITAGNTLTCTGGWQGIGFGGGDVGKVTIEATATLDLQGHLWAAFHGTSGCEINVLGNMNVGGNFAFNWGEDNTDGSGYIKIHDGGKLYLMDISGRGMDPAWDFKIDIIDNGIWQLSGDHTEKLQPWIDGGVILGNGTAGYVDMVYQDGFTYVQSQGRWDTGTDPLSVEEESIVGFEVYPNPTSDMINVNSQTKISSIKLYNVLGQKVQENEGKSSMDISRLNAGFYIINAVDVEGNKGVKRIVKQ